MLRKALHNNLPFYICTFISIFLIIASFLVPPLGIIDSTVIAAVGELFAFAALGSVLHALDEGKTATLTHKNTTLTVEEDKD